MLELEGVTKDFAGLRAVDGVSFSIAQGTITGLIGPNGAGKTTLFNMVAGAFPPSAGSIKLDGERIDGLPHYGVFAKGLVRTFQIPRPFAEMTVLENLMLVPRHQLGEHFWNTWIRNGAVRAQERAIRDKARDILDFIGLLRLADAPANTLSGGQQKLVEIARALMAEPKMILLDEPGAGVNPTLLGQIVERIAELNRRGITFLIIEHNMDLVMSLCRPVVVMAQGRLLMQGEPAAVQKDPRVLDAYLGGTPA
ncbi:MAG: ABC transporter ATP-binding protein [Rhodospirillaceae bacterium]|nr:ABC transporter ATP-binding protein [Rhodospirillaceae bacterium]